ncbi:MAG: hypothetical protein GY708_03110 [Actinomycetia bacterium]|nr:hypothetical protein [Actinomycetes bacterium]MCP3934343.1 hypothetical protein [Actinomycetes bacterium]
MSFNAEEQAALDCIEAIARSTIQTPPRRGGCTASGSTVGVTIRSFQSTLRSERASRLRGRLGVG